MNAGLILLSKSPQAPAVKTRLARRVGEQAARNLYTCFLKDLVATIAPLDVGKYLFYAPRTPLARDELAPLFSEPWILNPQSSGDLGQRMAHALKTCFQDGCQTLVLIGGDLPDLPRTHLEAAFDALATHDMVLGPSSDGGYYLVGARSQGMVWDIFKGADWKYKASLQQIRAQGKRCFSLPVWDDIDTWDDLQRLQIRYERPVEAPMPTYTLAYLAHDS